MGLDVETAEVRSVEEFLAKIRAWSQGWDHRWFRGEPPCDSPLVSRVRRPIAGDPSRKHDENRLLQFFRRMAPTYAPTCPDREATDQWLFLAQHVGLPTRLLDWTEGALFGLHFALSAFVAATEKRPRVIWMLDPDALNRLSLGADSGVPTGMETLALTWFDPNRRNIGALNIASAWENDATVGTDLPVAIRPSYVHPRMSVQRSCFTIEGRDSRSLKAQAPGVLRRFVLPPAAEAELVADLRVLGITHATVFPDLDGLARELADAY